MSDDLLSFPELQTLRVNVGELYTALLCLGYTQDARKVSRAAVQALFDALLNGGTLNREALMKELVQ